MEDRSTSIRLYHYQKPPKAVLTAKQRKWAIGYLTTGNASEAAVNAGYGDRRRGWENMTKRVHEKFLEECGEVSGIMDEVTPEHLYAEAVRMMREADNDGAKVRCMELAMRAQGMFVSSVEITDKTQDLDGMLSVLEADNPQLAAVLRRELGLDGKVKH